MALNLKNEETERLARELAARTGESLTVAVTVALQERLSAGRKPRGDPPGWRESSKSSSEPPRC